MKSNFDLIKVSNLINEMPTTEPLPFSSNQEKQISLLAEIVNKQSEMINQQQELINVIHKESKSQGIQTWIAIFIAVFSASPIVIDIIQFLLKFVG